jgi:IS30 family transposase
MVRRARAGAEVRLRFWLLLRDEWLTPTAAARSVGVSRATGYRWLAKAGGVIPAAVSRHGPSSPPVPVPRTLRLLPSEREDIACLKAARFSIREIARRIGRDPSTVSRELRREPVADGRYRASVAQADADRLARRPRPAKLATYLPLRVEVETRLQANHSPEQIARRLVEDFPDDPEMRVSHETIYQALYLQARGGLKRELTVHLRTGRSMRKPQRRSAERRGRIPNMVMISERPAEVADRAVPGHWEGDLILGAHGRSAIGTLVERKTRFVMLLHLPDGHGALAVQEAMVAKMAELPELLRRTLTWDQGKEMANHVQIAAATGLEIYFCDPHAPWQRGTNENTNGLLRQYFPKGTDVSIYGPGFLDQVAAELNGRPRKTLNWKTPAEALDKLLSEPFNPPGVALTA